MIERHRREAAEAPDSTARAPKLYTELASWWPLLSAPAEYAEEAEFYWRTLAEACDRPPRTLLELGSGGGNNASFLKHHVAELVLVDVSAGMLEVSRALNPECVHVEGDMRTVRLGRQFDAVFVHDAIVYMTTEADLRRAIETALVHCRPGGAALFAPDHVRENFRPSTDHGGHDAGRRGLRYLEWTWDPDPNDTTHRMDLTYVFHEPDGSVHVELDQHVCGLFPRATWLGLIEKTGFEVRAVPLTHDDRPVGAEGFLTVRPR